MLELMVAVAIAAILASIALNSYAGYVTRARLSDAWDGLANYRLRMEQAYQDGGSYGTAACTVATPAPTKYFTFACALANGGMTFVATATSTAAMPGYAYAVSDDGVQSTTAFPDASGLPASCWLSRVGDC